MITIHPRPKIIYLAGHLVRPKIILPAKEVYAGNSNNFIEVYMRPRTKYAWQERDDQVGRGLAQRIETRQKGGRGNFGYGYDWSH